MDTNQVKVWTRLIGTPGDDFSRGISVGSDDTVYVTGTANSDVFLTKYFPNGIKAWTKFIGTQSLENGGDICIAADGSIYVTGSTAGNLDGAANSGSADAFLTKYDGNGNRVWTKLIGTPSWDDGSSLTVGLDGSIYVSGWTEGDLDGEMNSGISAFITKYDATGNRAWTKLIGTSASKCLATGLDGSIYITGYTPMNLDGEINSGGVDAFLTKYDVNGNRAWTKLIGTSGDDIGYGLTVGLDGSIYVTGSTAGNLDGEMNSGAVDAFLSKYDVNGNRTWTKLIGTSDDEVGYGLTIGAEGSIYLAGHTEDNLDGEVNSGGYSSYSYFGSGFLNEYDINGNEAWTKLIGTSVKEDLGVAGSADGSIYVTGGTLGDLDGETNSGGRDGFLIKFRPASTSSDTLDVIVDLFGNVSMLKGLIEVDNGTVHTLSYNGTVFNYAEVDPLITTVVRNGEFTAEFAQEIADAYPSAAGIKYNTVVTLFGVAAIDDLLISVAGADGFYVS